MTGEQVVAIIGAVFLLFGALLTFAGTRGKTRTDAKTALDARIDARVTQQLESAWTSITALEDEVTALKQNDHRKMSAVGRILRAIAAQWPSAEGPDLDPADIAEIEDTVPAQWIRKPTPKETRKQ